MAVGEDAAHARTSDGRVLAEPQMRSVVVIVILNFWYLPVKAIDKERVPGSKFDAATLMKVRLRVRTRAPTLSPTASFTPTMTRTQTQTPTITASPTPTSTVTPTVRRRLGRSPLPRRVSIALPPRCVNRLHRASNPTVIALLSRTCARRVPLGRRCVSTPFQACQPRWDRFHVTETLDVCRTNSRPYPIDGAVLWEWNSRTVRSGNRSCRYLRTTPSFSLSQAQSTESLPLPCPSR